MPPLNKLTNEYAEIIDPALYEKMPKAVLAALAVSFALRVNEDDFSAVQATLLDEWSVLHSTGIVPQKPVKVK